MSTNKTTSKAHSPSNPISSINIYDFTDYKAYINAYVQHSQGRGEYRKLADALALSTTMISQVFNGDKHLNLSHASDLADYMLLTEDETDYLFLLVERATAGTYKLQNKLSRRIQKLRVEATRLEKKLSPEKELDEAAKTIFYSSWIYSAIRNLIALPKMRDTKQISNHLNLSTPIVQKVVDFLLEQGLLKKTVHGLEVGHKSTHLATGSPYVNRQHQNWRQAAIQKMIVEDRNDFFFSAPLSLTQEAANEFRQELPKLILKLEQSVKNSKTSEVVRCLNIDWFEF